MSLTIRVQTVSNAARNPQHCRRAICVHCRAQPAAQCSPQVVQSDAMESAQDHAFSEPLLAAMPQLKEKPHMGLPSRNPALYQGHEVCNSTTALGLRAALHLERIRSRYTGKERDTESGNDYFPARYYASSMGRFLSPDPSGLFMADPENPQMLNLYSYVGNNPLRYTDPLGLSKDCGGGGDPSVVCMVTSAWDWLKDHVGGGGSDQGQNPSAPGEGGGQGPEPGDQSPSVSPLRFPTRDAAGIAAARQALGPTSRPDLSNKACPAGCKYEWGGRILQDKKNGQYTFTDPVTFRNGTTFWTSHVMVPFGYRKAGSFHTHPGIGAPGMSGNPGDAGWADSQHLPEYMGEEMSGKVWKYAGDNSCSAEPCGQVIDPKQ